MRTSRKILYISNIEVPYRTKFFNMLSRYCDLTVLYERIKSSNRDDKWSNSEEKAYKMACLDGTKIKEENAFSLKIFKYILGGYDCVIVGCYNSPIQILAILIMRLLRKKYILSTDGEQFIDLTTTKGRLKAFFLKGADKYLSAGEMSAETLRKVVGDKTIIPYYFSSLTKEELIEHAQKAKNTKRDDYVLVVGQYFDYKGLDIAVKAATVDQSIRYKFIGMGKRMEQFIKDTGVDKLKNVEIIPFLQKKELEEEYLKCAVMVLPSRQECWGLVINEAASFGTPIVSTWGSGAAVEFLSDEYADYLAEVGNAEDLYTKIRDVLNDGSFREKLSDSLIAKSKSYYIENNVEQTLLAF